MLILITTKQLPEFNWSCSRKNRLCLPVTGTVQAEGQKNVYPLNERVSKCSPIYSNRYEQHLYPRCGDFRSHLGQVSSAMVTCSSICTGTQVQGSFLVYLTSCARSTGLEVSQNHHFLSQNQKRKDNFTFGIHFPPRKLPHIGHFGGLCLVT